MPVNPLRSRDERAKGGGDKKPATLIAIMRWKHEAL